jgi:hypothetical protein
MSLHLCFWIKFGFLERSVLQAEVWLYWVNTSVFGDAMID